MSKKGVRNVEGAVISIDWEMRGKSLRDHGANGFGAALFDASGELKRTLGFGIRTLAGQGFDPATKSEFWDKNPAALAWCETDAVTPAEAAARIVEFYRAAKAEYGKVTWVCWPASYDWGILVYYMNTYFPGPYPIEEHKAVCVSSMNDAYSLAKNMRLKPTPSQLGGEGAAHFPTDDAIVQGRAFFALWRKIQQINVH